MKNKSDLIWRKHGRLGLEQTREKHVSHTHAERVKTSLTFASEHQAYLWTTDRGRSRLIKH